MSELHAGEGVPRRLSLSCPDRPGIVAEVTGLLAGARANITDLDQHSEPEVGRFAMRVEFTVADDSIASLDAAITEAFSGEGVTLRLSDPAERPAVAILCSNEDHCLTDLLWRFGDGELPGRVTTVISTSDRHAGRVAGFGLPFSHLPVESRDQMPAHEAALLTELRGNVDLVVLARYMRVLSADFLEQLGCPAINIHHSFLPSFKGAEPYRRAHDRGVKLIGATAHYVTADLDEGPIIEQDVVRVTHRQSAEDLKRIGRDVERVVLARAVRAHLEDRVVRWGERTVVFS